MTSPGTKPKIRRIGIGSAMGLVAVLAVCLGCLREAPGLSFVVMLVLIPSALRAVHQIETQRASGQPLKARDAGRLAIACFVFGVVLLPVSGMALLASCFPVGLLGFMAAGSRRVGPWPLGIAWGVGLVVGCSVGYVLIGAMLRSRSRKPRTIDPRVWPPRRRDEREPHP